jgi:Lsr2 protein
VAVGTVLVTHRGQEAGVATKVTVVARGSPGRRRSGDIRAWAKDAGIQVSDRGRIPASVVAQYQAATGAP